MAAISAYYMTPSSPSSEYVIDENVSMQNLMANIGPESVIMQGLDQLLDQGIAAGMEGDVDTLKKAVASVTRLCEDENIRAVLVKAMSYNGKSGTMDLLKKKSSEWFNLTRIRSPEVTTLLSRATNPAIAAFELKKSLNDPKKVKDFYSLIPSLNQAWSDAKALAQVGNLTAAKTAKEELALKIAINRSLLEKMSAVKMGTGNVALACFSERATYFSSGQYLFDPDAKGLFEANLNLQVNEFQDPQNQRNGFTSTEATTRHGTSSEDITIRSSLISTPPTTVKR